MCRKVKSKVEHTLWKYVSPLPRFAFKVDDEDSSYAATADLVSCLKMSRFFPRLRAPVLKNEGSVARDQLAQERTFLSWLRTGLGFIALGIGVERFSRLESHTPASFATSQTAAKAQKQKDKQNEHVLVTSLLGIGSTCILYGAGRYFSNLKLLTQGLFKPAYHGAGVLSIAVAGLAGGAWMGIASDDEDG